MCYGSPIHDPDKTTALARALHTVVLVWTILPMPAVLFLPSLSSYLFMWLSLASSPASPDLVISAATRLFWSAPVLLLAVSIATALMALVMSVRLAERSRLRNREHARTVQTLQTRERRLRLTVSQSDDGHVVLEPVRDSAGDVVDFVVAEANDSAATLFRRDLSSVLGLRTSSLASLSIDTDLFRALRATATTGVLYQAEVRAHPRHVASSWLRIRATAMDNGVHVSLRDIRDRMRESARLRRASMTDGLTGLLNRRGLLAVADERLRDSQAAGHDAILLYLDCDAFKQINDQHGHAVGDRALTEISRALRGAMRDTDVVARMGGDEFVVLAFDAVGLCADSIRARIAERMAQLNLSGMLPCAVSVSLGHVYAPCTQAMPLAQLLECADRDLLERKRAKREASKLIIPAVGARSSRRARHGTARPVNAPQLTEVVTAA